MHHLVLLFFIYNFSTQDFDSAGIPLSTNELGSGPRSRSLDLDAAADDLVEMKPLLPLDIPQQRSTAIPFYSYQEQQVLLHRQLINHHLQEQRHLTRRRRREGTHSHHLHGQLSRHLSRRKRRDVTLNSHRLPGTIDSQFLMFLVDQLNYTSKENLWHHMLFKVF